MASFFQMNTAFTSRSGSLPSNTIANPKGELKAITTRSDIVLDEPSVPIPPPFINLEEDECVEETLTDHDLVEYTIKVPPPLVQKPKPPSQRNFVVYQRDPLHPNIPYPSRMYKQKQQEKDKKMLKALISNKEKLLELANTPLNENCSAVILKKLPEKLGDLGKFLIPCGFSELKCKALADLEVKDDVFDPDHVIKPLFPFPIPVEDNDSFLEKSDTSLSYSDNSLPVYETLTIIRKRRIVAVPLLMLITLFPKPQVHVPNVLTTHMLDSNFIPSDNSLPKSKIFYFDIEEKNNGSTTIHADTSLPNLDCFNFKPNPDVSHRCETFMKFNVYPKLLNERPMKILSSSCSLLDQLKYGGNWVKLSDPKQALRGRHPMLILVFSNE
nr:hypothetical protein [Tanacetum cinerariifolium]GEW69591.1 hypothetical protein [Tanacetum cinerariifolium]